MAFAELIDLNKEKARRRKCFLQRYGTQLDTFIASFLEQNLNIEFSELAYAYQAHQNELEDATWDYLDLREIVAHLVRESVTTILYLELCQQPWFERSLISQDQLTERCIPIFVFGISAAANE